MRKQVFVKQRTPEWLAWKKGKLGASDMASLTLDNPHRSPLMTFHKIVMEEETPVNSFMQRGIDLEPLARAMASERLGIKFEEACFEHVSRPYLIASLDGWCEGQGGIELKVSDGKVFELAEKGIVDPMYMPQCQTQMLVSVYGETFFGVYSEKRDEMAIVFVKKDNEMCDRIEAISDDFMRRIREGDAPEPIEIDYPRFSDNTKLAPRVLHAKEQAAFWDKEYKSLKSEAIAQVGSRNAYLGELKITRSERPGNVDYDLIPELIGKNLDQYRKDRVVSYRFS
jgi:putative phage-type endonuclease